MNDCLFCKMVEKIIPVDPVYEDEHIFVIKDINPQAPIHLLAIPKKHFPAIHMVEEDDQLLFTHLNAAIRQVLHSKKIADKGYRLVINSGETAGQSVDHIHVHILSGRRLSWPPG